MSGFKGLFLSVCVLAFLFGPYSSGADESSATRSQGQSSTKIENVLKDKKFEEDKRITDLELKAQAGSLSRYSLKFNLGYSGPPVTNLSDTNRPNPDNRSGDYRTNLSGSLGLRYRVSSDQAINLGTGMKWYTPYQAITGQPVEKRPKDKNYDINDPYVGFDQTYAFQNAQFRSGAKYAQITTEYYRRNAQFGTFSLDQAVKYNPGRERWVLGLLLSADYFAFSRQWREGDATNISKYYLTLAPSVEYKLTDKVNFNTSLGYSYQNLRTDHSYWRWRHPMTGWRVGAGWAIRRDVYINPYLNFFVDKPSFKTASASMSAVFSLF
jgi:hypothetical protein